MKYTVLAYDGDENGDQNRLNNWLGYEVWSCNDAALILADIDPESVVDDFKWATTFRGVPIVDRDDQGSLIHFEVEDDGTILYKGVDNLKLLLAYYKDVQRTLVEKNKASPQEWIDNAISKKIYIPWLEWAKKRKLVGCTGPEPATGTHISKKLRILNQAAFTFWANADRDDRGTHPSNADVAAWLMDQAGYSTTLANKAATIIRPEWAPTGRKPEE